MTCRLTCLLFGLLISVSLGCAGMGPRWSDPGTTMEQRNRAVVHDPYVDNKLGPPVVGGRPRDYLNPLAEPEGNRVFRDSPFFVPLRPLP